MILELIAFAAAIAGVLYFVKHKNTKPKKSTEASKPSAGSAFRAVSIYPGLNSCRIALELQGERFLPDEVPMLPLDGCDEQSCTCRFRHYSDRRDEDDRRTPFQHGIAAIIAQDKGNRREQEDRRDEDEDDELT